MERFPRMKKSTPPVTRAFEADCYVSLGAEIERHIIQGKRTLLITSSGPGEGKSTIAAGLAGVLARLRGIKAVLVDTDQYRPSQHRLFNVTNSRGLGELLADVYQSDPTRVDANRLGFGDWIELLQVQGRSGKLVVAENGQAYVVSLMQGAIVSIVEQKSSEDRLLGDDLASRGLLTASQRDIALRLCDESREPLGDIVLRLGYVEPEALHAAQRAQVAERLQRILAMRRPRCEFSGKEADDLASRMRRQWPNPDAWGIDAHLGQQMRDFMKRPYLTRQIESYLKETEVGSLKILTSGVAPSDLMTSSGSLPLSRLLENLSRMFDVVIVDSPPVAVTSPAEAIAQMVDGVLLVVKAGGYDVQVIRRAKERLESRGVHLLGTVLNQVDFQHADNSLHYYYSYTHPAAAGDARPPVPLPGRASSS